MENRSGTKSEVTLGHNDAQSVTNMFGGQDLNQASTNSTSSLDSFDPSFYESVLDSNTKPGTKLSADDYIELPAIKGANSQKNKLLKVVASEF